MRGVLVVLVCLVFAGCGGSLAQTASEQGEPCNAHTLEPSNGKYAAECERQQHSEQVHKEAGEVESVLKKRRAEELANTAEGR